MTKRILKQTQLLKSEKGHLASDDTVLEIDKLIGKQIIMLAQDIGEKTLNCAKVAEGKLTQYQQELEEPTYPLQTTHAAG